MTQYSSVNVKLSDLELNELKSAAKYETGVALRLSPSMISNSNDNYNFSYKLLLANTQVANLRKTPTDSLSAKMKLPKTEVSKII